jgi:hypothetical protein
LILVTPLLVNSREILVAQGMMHDGMMGEGGDMNIIHQLFAHRSQIHRTVTEIPHGIQAVTESDDRDMVDVIREHAGEINGFVEEGMPAMMDNMMR